MAEEIKQQKKPRHWKGALARKIRPQVNRPRGLAVTDEKTLKRANHQIKKLCQQEIEKAYDEKLVLLAKHYGIAVGDYRRLAIALAEKSIPGFQVQQPLVEIVRIPEGGLLVPFPKTGGRPIDWPSEKLDKLMVAVEDVKKRSGCETDLEALRVVARNPQWRGHTIKTLQNRLAEARMKDRQINYRVKALQTMLAGVRKKYRQITR